MRLAHEKKYARQDTQDFDKDNFEDQKKAEEYADKLRKFMDDFEPSDQLTSEIEAHGTQSYQVRV